VQCDALINKTPKFALLMVLVVIFETYESEELIDIYMDEDMDGYKTCHAGALFARDIEMFTDLAKFKAAKIDPRFYTNAKSLGIPINLRPL